MNHHIRDLTDRFAREGFIAIAPELFHRTAPAGFEGSYTDFATVAPHMQAMTPAGMEADLRASWEWDQRQSGLPPAAIACVGYCKGGRAAFLANSFLPFKAAVSYYGGRIAPDLLPRAASLSGPMLFFWGGLDSHIPAEQISAITDALGKAGKPYVNVVMSDAGHGFFCDERASFNAQAAKEAWALTLAFLREKLA